MSCFLILCFYYITIDNKYNRSIHKIFQSLYVVFLEIPSFIRVPIFLSISATNAQVVIQYNLVNVKAITRF